MLRGVDTISLLYEQDCARDNILSMDNLWVARDKPDTVLDRFNTPMDIPHSIVVMTWQHRRDEEVEVAAFGHAVQDVPHCDDTVHGGAIRSSEVGRKEVQYGDE